MTGEPARFDHRVTGTPEPLWASSPEVQAARPLPVDGLRRLVVTAAHPDDETLGAGGLLARAAALGVEVIVLVASAGEASHPDSPTHGRDELAVLRRTELRRAVARLAPAARVEMLSLPDGHLRTVVRLIVAEIRRCIGDGGPATWVVSPWQDDGHPDHAAMSVAARQAAAGTGCRMLEYPIWAWHWACPGDGVLPVENLVAAELAESERDAKDGALAEYRSQVTPLSAAAGDEPVVPPGFRAHFRRDREVFIQVPPPVEVPDRGSLGRRFFDEFYSSGPDPWGFRSRWYERRKRDITLACLPREHFVSGFEPGCSIGVLTAALADRCEHLLATDISAAPLAVARDRLRGRPGVTFGQLRVPAEWPPGRFDLIVLSEIGYYCGAADLTRLITAAASAMTGDGVLLACHWRHPVADYPSTGDEVHHRLRRESGLEVLVEHIEEDFRLDVLTPPPALSVARREGLVC